MKTITKFQSNDGSEWESESKALFRDALLLRVQAAMCALGNPPTHEQSEKGWIQHDPETVMRCKRELMELLKADYAESYPVFNEPAEKINPLGIIGRILDDCGDGPRERAFRRFANIDKEGREHQQPYYAYTAGPRPEHICVEDRR